MSNFEYFLGSARFSVYSSVVNRKQDGFPGFVWATFHPDPAFWSSFGMKNRIKVFSSEWLVILFVTKLMRILVPAWKFYFQYFNIFIDFDLLIPKCLFFIHPSFSRMISKQHLANYKTFQGEIFESITFFKTPNKTSGLLFFCL